MTLLILIALFLLGVAIAIRGGLALLMPGAAPQRPRLAGLLPAIGVDCAVLGLGNQRSAALPIPIGYAGGDGGLALDPLSCLFALLLFATAWFVECAPMRDRALDARRDLTVAAILLALLAGDVFLLATGAVLALLALDAGGGRTRRLSIAAAIGIAGACALLSQRAAPSGALLAASGFAQVRAEISGGGVLLPVLALLGTVPLLGLWPAPRLLLRRAGFAPVWVPVLGSLLGLFLLVRLLLDLAGPVPSGWWGAALVLLGLGSAMRAGIDGLGQGRLRTAIGALIAVQSGLAVAAIGLCLLAKADDMPVLADSAFAAMLLFLPLSSLAGLAALSLAATMEQEAGSGLVIRLGGLAMSMPRACLVMAASLGLLGFLPPGGGFAALWLLLQCALAADLPLLAGVPVPTAILVAAIAVVASLGAASVIRLAWVAGLGRPRTPRGAAATDSQAPALRRHGAVLALALLASLLPGVWLRGQGGSGAASGGQAGSAHPLLALVSPGGTTMLAPLPILLAVGLMLGAIVLALRRFADQPERREPAWEGGAPPPPPWLPFGDPATQIAPRTLVLALGPALRHALGLPAVGGLPVWRLPSWSRARPALLRMRAASALAGRLLADRGERLAAVASLLLLLALALGWLGTGPVSAGPAGAGP